MWQANYAQSGLIDTGEICLLLEMPVSNFIAFIGWFSVIVALGGLLVGNGLLLPKLTMEQTLVDINLAHALALPLIDAVATTVLIATFVLCTVVSRWVPQKFALTLGLVNLGVLGTDRLFLIPNVATKWAQIDLLTQRPSETFREAQLLWNLHNWLLTTAALIFVVLVLLASNPVSNRLASDSSTRSPSPSS